MATMRTMIAGLGTAGAAGAAVLTTISLKHTEADHEPAALLKQPGLEICLRTKIPFFEKAGVGCFRKSDLAKLRDAPVLNDAGAPVTMNMSHPTDFNRDMKVARNCADYRKMSKDEWYAASSREMRRERYFERACGVLTYLMAAEEATVSHFKDGRIKENDILSFSSGPPVKITSGSESEGGEVTVDQIGDGVWRLSAIGQQARVREIAHADFNGDGVGDMLVFVAINVVDGTASAGSVGYLEKTEPDGDVRFRR